ncbi:hypothetical protein phiOC_p245 [Ochrobactrum phage vB_OspM_OC]|nr:hypothetical protein phiOC_p245 [Ochrobactrum phage vB_OspM_OC]
MDSNHMPIGIGFTVQRWTYPALLAISKKAADIYIPNTVSIRLDYSDIIPKPL